METVAPAAKPAATGENDKSKNQDDSKLNTSQQGKGDTSVAKEDAVEAGGAEEKK